MWLNDGCQAPHTVPHSVAFCVTCSVCVISSRDSLFKISISNQINVWKNGSVLNMTAIILPYILN